MLKQQALRILAANGTPLDLTTQHQGATQYTVHAKDRGSFQMFSQLGPDEFAQEMASELRYYPDSVTLNGEPVKTTPFPDLAKVTVTSFQQHTTKYPDAKQIALETWPETPILPKRSFSQRRLSMCCWFSETFMIRHYAV